MYCYPDVIFKVRHIDVFPRFLKKLLLCLLYYFKKHLFYFGFRKLAIQLFVYAAINELCVANTVQNFCFIYAHS